MKSSFFALLILSLPILNSCQNDHSNSVKTETNEKGSVLNGTWTLFKEDKNGKHHDYSGRPTAVSLTLKENGYFIFFDKITDKEISESGVAEIQERYKGQFEATKDELKLNHFFNDSLISENYSIEKLSENELVLKNLKTNNIQYYKK